MEIINNPFGTPKDSCIKCIKGFLAVMTREMGLYKAYNSDTLVKTYRYCKRELGDEFDNYVRAVRCHIRLQEADYKSGKVAIHYLTDVFTKFPQIIEQLKREGKWDGEYPAGWSVDSTGAPFHKDYRLVARGLDGFTYIGEKSYLVPVTVVYNKDKNKFIKITNTKTGEVIWSA